MSTYLEEFDKWWNTLCCIGDAEALEKSKSRYRTGFSGGWQATEKGNERLQAENEELRKACEAQEEADNWFGASDTGRKLKNKAKELRVDAIAKTKRNT